MGQPTLHSDNASDAPEPAGLAHAVFLERIGQLKDERSSEARRAIAAFLIIRFADQFTVPSAERHTRTVFEYQSRSIAGYLDELVAEYGDSSTEVNYLLSIGHATRRAARRGDLATLLPAVFAYGFYLEQEFRHAEALDALETALRLQGAGRKPGDVVPCHLALARVKRKLAMFQAAKQSYIAARDLAQTIRDRHSVLLARIGCAGLHWRQGNLPEGLRQLDQIASDAEAAGDTDALARAAHDLGVVHDLALRPADGIQHVYRAYQLYEDEDLKLRALHDVGMMLKALGDYGAATDAFATVSLRGRTLDARTNSLLELMDNASYAGDRLTFERYNAQCARIETILPPRLLADFYRKRGAGLARFGFRREADTAFDHALNVASSAGFDEVVERIERTRVEVFRARVPKAPRRTADADSPDWIATRDVAASLRELALASA